MIKIGIKDFYLFFLLIMIIFVSPIIMAAVSVIYMMVDIEEQQNVELSLKEIAIFFVVGLYSILVTFVGLLTCVYIFFYSLLSLSEIFSS